jgi:MFS family permease
MFMILLPLYVLELGGGAAVASYVVAGIGLGMLLFDIPAGFLASRYGDKKLILVGTLLATVCGFALAYVQNYWLIFVIALLRGVGSAAWLIGLLSYFTDSLESEERGRAIAVVGGTFRFGGLGGPIVGGVVATTFGFDTAFVITGALAAIATVFVTIQAYGVHTHIAAPRAAISRLKDVVVSYARVFITAGYAVFGLQTMRAARQLMIPLLGAHLGLDATSIGLIFSASAAVDMILVYPTGMAMDRFGRKIAGIPCMVLFVIGLALLPTADSFASLLVVALFLGVANGLGSGIVLTMGSDLAPQERRGEFLGVWRLIGDGGAVSAPAIIGALVAVSSLATAAYAVAGIGTSATLVLMLFVQETLQRKRPSTPQIASGK